MNKDFCSIEGDKNFYKFMSKKVDKNKITLKSLGIVKEYSIPVSLPFNYEKTFLTKKQKLKIKNYCSVIFELSNTKGFVPDLILVDGRYRNLCGLYLYKYFKGKNQNFIIIFDDYIERKNHHILEEFFEMKILKRFGIATKIKENKSLEATIEKNYFDCR
tara:strand:- start:172 stop:651 length:480 start_codon:yes stop_codon:yes gene_type:complete